MLKFVKNTIRQRKLFKGLRISNHRQIQIKILGTGCKKCNYLYENALKAVAELKLNADVKIIKDFDVMISSYGVRTLPGLVINEKLASAGQVLAVDKIKMFISQINEL